jgi:hypothetical protein
MLVHGFADDNVLAAHSLQLSNLLLASGRHHEFLPLCNCTHMTPEMREELFMNSRDRMRSNSLSQELDEQLESFLGEEQTLQTLNRNRREEQIKKSLEDQKPLEDTLRQLLKVNPKLAELLPFGMKLPANSFGLGAGNTGTSSFEGKKHPTYFRFKKNNLIADM